MSTRSNRTPGYRLHRPSGFAVVTLNGRDIDLGRHGTPDSKAAYGRATAEWRARGGFAPTAYVSTGVIVDALILAGVNIPAA